MPSSQEDLNHSLVQSTIYGDVECMKSSLSLGANVNATDDDGVSVLFHAVCNGNDSRYSVDVVKAILTKELNINEVRYDDKYTALLVAIKAGRNDIAIILIESGADFNLKSSVGETALTVAATGGDVMLVSSLISHGADIEETTEQGYTPLMFAAYNDEYELVDFLLKSGANPYAANSDGESIIDVSFRQGSITVAAYIQAFSENAHILKELSDLPKNELVKSTTRTFRI